MRSNLTKLILLTLFAVAMAQVEAAIVVHLRTIYYPDDPRSLFPLAPLSHRDLAIELVRETATVVMIVTLSFLTARRFRNAFVVFVYVFGVWDIFYYVWLKMMIGWPTAWSEWDVLFLIPWPWFGPWITPAAVALVFSAWGAKRLWCGQGCEFDRTAGALFLVGFALVLTTFLTPALPLLSQGEAAFNGYEPTGFQWVVYLAGLVLLTIGLIQSRCNSQIDPTQSAPPSPSHGIS
jgi:hypothetical protein